MLFMDKNKKLIFLLQIVVKDVVGKVLNQAQNQTHAQLEEEEEKLGPTKGYLQYNKHVLGVAALVNRNLTLLRNVRDLAKHKLKEKYPQLITKEFMKQQE